jgi:hypothetical protein
MWSPPTLTTCQGAKTYRFGTNTFEKGMVHLKLDSVRLRDEGGKWGRATNTLRPRCTFVVHNGAPSE